MPEHGVAILEGIASNRSRREIASELGITERAVDGRTKTMLDHLRKRMGRLGPLPGMESLRVVVSRPGAIEALRRAGWLERSEENDMRPKIIRVKVVPRAVKWVGRADGPANTSPASVPDRGGPKKSIGGLESDVVGAAADVGQSADSRFQLAGDGVRLKKVGGGLKKMGVESDDARFQSAESGVRVDDIGGGLKKGSPHAFVGARIERSGTW
jgi:hypothetical protein